RRKETIERSFADSKQNHGYRFAQYRGVAKMQQYTWLSCAAQNMKKMAILLTRDSHFLQYSSLFIIFKCKIQRIFQNWRNTLDFLSLLSTV
ncbi:transposase, partial [Granulicatella sp. zg-84]